MLAFDPAQLTSYLVGGGLLLFAGVVASKVAGRLGLPALAVFLGVGMLLGSDVLGVVAFDDPDVARAIGSVALASILFAGGLDTPWRDARPVVGPGVVLATAGVLVTGAVVGLFATWVLGVPLPLGLLLGATVSSTDAAAVFSVLRTRDVGLPHRLRSLLEVESGSNDPMAILATVVLLAWVEAGSFDALGAALMLTSQLSIGLVGGLVFGGGLGAFVRHVDLDQHGLYPVVSVAFAAVGFSVVDLLGGSGFLAVYVAGVVVGNTAAIHVKRLQEFHDGIAWMMQIVLFLGLGLLSFPSRLPDVAAPSIAILVVLMVVARPVAVWACLPRGWTNGERLLISWVGLRGAAPILLATFPLAAGLDGADIVFDVVFFVVLHSVVLQGSTMPAVVRKLGLARDVEPRAVESRRGHGPVPDLVHYVVAPSAPADGTRLVDLGLPEGVLVVLVVRGDERLIPEGSTRLRAGDQLTVLADAPERAAVRGCFLA